MTHHGVRGVPRGDRFSPVCLDRARALRLTVAPVGRRTATTVTALPYPAAAERVRPCAAACAVTRSRRHGAGRAPADGFWWTETGGRTAALD